MTDTANREPTARRDTARFSGPSFWAGVGVGVSLMLFGVSMPILGLAALADTRLVMCTGLGILLAAFGAQAEVKQKLWVITGCGAIALILYFALDHIGNRVQFAKGQIHDASDAVSVDVAGEHSFLVALRNGTYNFAAESTLVHGDFVRVTVVYGRDEEFDFNCVPMAYVRQALGQQKPVEWRIDRKKQELLRNSDRKVIARNACKDGPIAVADIGDAGSTAAAPPPFIGGARAQSTTERQRIKTARPVDEVLRDLRTEQTTLRREARDELSSLGVDMVVPGMKAFHAAGADDYRMRLGIVVALTQALRIDKGRARAMSERLTRTDLLALLKLVEHPDRTMRLYATEFLFDLGDARTVMPALDMARATTSDDTRYNLVLIVSNAYRALPAAERPPATAALRALSGQPTTGPKTKDTIERILRG
ncbi:MAG: hypothetical protein FJX20_00680 [Alphaproteobacteria bacterium]|nr:hypothetical protein [Alphaproteobacteria bacterium]